MNATSSQTPTPVSRVVSRLLWLQISFAVLAVAVSVFVLRSVKPLAQEREQLEQQVDALREQLGETEASLQNAELRLQEATDLGQYVHPIDFVASKFIASRYPRQAPILERILSLRQENVPWRLGGRSPSEGFDSPGFAAYVLRQFQLPGGDVPVSSRPVGTAQTLLDRLPSTAQPEVGDLVFYPAGYVMFYFHDEANQPFVIGMTPSGITSLRPDFAEPWAYRRPTW